MNNKLLLQTIICSVLLLTGTVSAQETGIKPYTKNQYYWQYNNEPVLLIGGSSNDNLFQNEDIVLELNQMQAIGANYVRCTLSGRDVGDEWPFWRTSRFYNLNKFNPDYWKLLDDFFRQTYERNIFVQLEVWAFYDFTEDWARNPWNPAQNNVLTEENTRLKANSYGDFAKAKHDFFYSVPKLNNDSLLLEYQKMFVDHLLSISLKYDNILYCITNEIFSQLSAEWGWYWAEYLKQKAAEAGKQIQVTEMFQNGNELHEQQHPEMYSFIDFSQNSRRVRQEHWEQLQGIRNVIAGSPRPINHIKTYGGSFGEWTDGPNHGIFRFWRNLVGGAAAIRFHRPPLGIGISERAQAQIKSARMVINEYDFFTSQPDVNFVRFDERENDEAYLATNADSDAVLYFPDGGQVVIDFTDFEGIYELKWLNLEGANWYSKKKVEGGEILELKTPYAGGWVAVLKRN